MSQLKSRDWKAFFQCGVVLCATILFSSCGFRKKDAATDGANGGAGSPPPGSAASLQLGADDWQTQTGHFGKADATIKTVKPEKLDFIRKNFHVPTLTAVTVPESNGFELYQVHGYPDLEGAVYIEPKVYINTGNGEGQVLGYRTGKKDPAGHELIEISVPVALVNGLVPSIPTVGGEQDGAGAAVNLPAKYQIPSLTALKQSVGGSRDVKTLPVCPTLFRLTFQDREYWAKSPFENLSTCPVNQFFRITFQAPVDEMQTMLETAAVRDEAVSLITNLQVAFDVPNKVVEVSFSPEDFHQTLKGTLKNVPVSGKDASGQDGYELQDIEQAVTDSLFKLAKDSGFDPRYSPSLLSAISPLILNEFGEPFACSAGGTCRSLLAYPFQRTPVSFSWSVGEQLAASLEMESVTALGAVANSSAFIAKPSLDVLSLVRRPQYFRGRDFKDVVKECQQLEAANFAFNPESTPDGQAYFKAYCQAMVANGVRDDGATDNTDGYYPLGSNTVVYPGAWLKIDIDDISELTTAKTRTLADGTVEIQSDVVDLLANDPTAKRTECIDGNAVACTEYKTKDIAVRASNGDQMYSSAPCQKGEAGCDCERKNNADGSPGDEVCSKKNYLFQQVKDYTCDAKDEYTYCPYWRNEDQVVDYEREWDCQTVTVQDSTTFLCLGGCESHQEVRCNLKSSKPVTAARQKYNCVGYDPAGTAPPVTACRAPKYECAKWATNCTKYSVNEVFQVVHEDVAPKWRPFAINKGEYPKRFEEDILLKFVSPGRTVTGCHLDRFPREFRGNSVYIKMPDRNNDGIQPCDEPLWDATNTQPLYLPKVFIKNQISYPERRLCGRTQYSFTTKEVPMTNGDGLVPPEFAYKTEADVGPVPGSCRAEAPFQIGSDLWFTEYPPIRFSGRVSVLGRVLESIVTEDRP